MAVTITVRSAPQLVGDLRLMDARAAEGQAAVADELAVQANGEQSDPGVDERRTLPADARAKVVRTRSSPDRRCRMTR
jgi:hypothetical protein